MKKQTYILLLVLLSLLIGTRPMSAQIIDENGQYVDTTFNDNINRSADDFVIASLLVADPGTVLYSVLGHACIRLQCPAFDMDYCFSYESEGVQKKVLSFLAGKLMMGLFAIPIDEYCEQYRKEGRGVYEYTLNLPIEVKRELWRVLDNHLAEGIRLPYDYFHRGCAITAKNFVEKALGETKIVYDKSLYDNSLTVKELWNKNTKNALWVRFICYFIGAGTEVEQPLSGDKQLIIPIDLAHAWQQATVNGEPLLASEPIVLVEGKPQITNGWFSPMVLALLLILLTIANLFWNKPYFDWLIILIQAIVGCGLIYLTCFSELCCTDWNWLIIPFNPLPAILWYWRKHWALPFASILALWCIAMMAIIVWGNILVCWSHIMIVLAFTLIAFKQSNIWQHRSQTHIALNKQKNITNKRKSKYENKFNKYD